MLFFDAVFCEEEFEMSYFVKVSFCEMGEWPASYAVVKLGWYN